MQIGDKIADCFMRGIGDNDNICNAGVVEAIGADWVIVRDKQLDRPIFVDMSIRELEDFLNKP